MEKSEGADHDWRLDLGPENLFDATLVKKRYRAWSESWEHEHCIYCTSKLMDPRHSEAHALLIEENPEILTTGFVVQQDGAAEGQRADVDWVCETCAEDFRERFRWRLVTADPLPESAKKAER